MSCGSLCVRRSCLGSMRSSSSNMDTMTTPSLCTPSTPLRPDLRPDLLLRARRARRARRLRTRRLRCRPARRRRTLPPAKQSPSLTAASAATKPSARLSPAIRCPSLTAPATSGRVIENNHSTDVEYPSLHPRGVIENAQSTDVESLPSPPRVVYKYEHSP